MLLNSAKGAALGQTQNPAIFGSGDPTPTSRQELLNAMNGKILSKGVYIGIAGQK